MYDLTPFSHIPLDVALLEHLLDEHERVALPRLARLWRYFRNDLSSPTHEGGSSGPPAQRAGLPTRLVRTDLRNDDRARREVVIENDIAWRIHTLVDFMFPDEPRIVSRARDAQLRASIERVIADVLESNGGMSLWQDVALLGAVYGHVDLLVDAEGLFAARVDDRSSHGSSAMSRTAREGNRHTNGEAAQNPLASLIARDDGPGIRIEAVEAPRAIPLLSGGDYRALDAYIVHFTRSTHELEQDGAVASLVSRALRPLRRRSETRSRVTRDVTSIYASNVVQRYENEVLVHESVNRLNQIPVVHIQNLAQPFLYEGISDVEPLIPLQDELNTRLSDRANRVTMQSFRMWLGKGIDGFTDRPVGPGQMWLTDNEQASIESFGGDADSPSEKQHIEELREALDKASGVTPAAAGHIKAKIGNLTSENALRVSLMGTIAKIKRKRITYGRGIEQLSSLILHALDVAGVLRTAPEDRHVDIVWPDPLPADESRRIQDAIEKSKLGVPLDALRAELGYTMQTRTG